MKAEETEYCVICHRFIGVGNDMPVCSKECEKRMEIEILHDAEYRKAISGKTDTIITGMR